jgi:co-chaperonin GroES (HSP10)
VNPWSILITYFIFAVSEKNGIEGIEGIEGVKGIKGVTFNIQNMALSIDENDLNKFIVIGDRVLIQPKTPDQRTKSGLYLPPGVQEKEKLQSGYVLKVGPGYPIPAITDVDEPWKDKSDELKYVPLQPKEGDLAIYIQNNAYEIEFKKEKYVIVPHSAILMLIRDEGLLK